MSDHSTRKHKRALWRRFRRNVRPDWVDFNTNWEIVGDGAHRKTEAGR